MTLFEYITVVVSIVLSFGMIRLLGGLRPALSREGRYWVHVAWVGIKLLNLLLFWWGFWNLRDTACPVFAMAIAIGHFDQLLPHRAPHNQQSRNYSNESRCPSHRGSSVITGVEIR